MTTLMTNAQLQEPDLPSALFLAAVCGQAYTQFSNKDTGIFIVPQNYRLVGEIKANAMGLWYERYGFIIESDDCTILAFRGSSTSMDWVSDFIAQQKPFPFIENAGNTHKGFTDIYMSVRPAIFELLEHIDPNKPLFITGHSLGGALATLAAIDIAHNSTYGPPIVYTFGAPRVGDPNFVKLYNYSVPLHWRIQNKYDIVPHLPTLVYHSPNTDETYYYLHVKGEVLQSFRYGSVASNHLLESYFKHLAKSMPDIANQMCESPLGWCPIS